MTFLNLRPYRIGDAPAARSVPVSVIILTKDEAANIERCISSVAWAAQVIVVDSESTDGTTHLAERSGAEVVVEPWRGFAAQREFALRLPLVAHDWVYFVDADEWVSPQLASEIEQVTTVEECDAYAQRFRLVFMDTWIRHCGWYGGSWIVRLMRRSRASFGVEQAGERAHVSAVGRLKNDIVDEDRKGLARWLRKHISYAEIEARQSTLSASTVGRIKAFVDHRSVDTRPLPRALAKDLVLPLMPARPLAIFLYMYVLRLGFLDGKAGLAFCFYHAWYRCTIELLKTPNPAPALMLSTSR